MKHLLIVLSLTLLPACGAIQPWSLPRTALDVAQVEVEQLASDYPQQAEIVSSALQVGQIALDAWRRSDDNTDWLDWIEDARIIVGNLAAVLNESMSGCLPGWLETLLALLASFGQSCPVDPAP